MREPVHLTGAQVSILTQAAASLAQLEEYFEVEAQVPQFLEHFEQAKAILESTLHDGKDVVLRTQENFQKLASSEGPKQASNAFFTDIIGRYRTQEELLSNELDRDGYRTREALRQQVETAIRTFPQRSCQFISGPTVTPAPDSPGATVNYEL